MEKSRQSDKSLVATETGVIVAIKIYSERSRMFDNRLVELGRKMHDSQRMLEAAVHCSWIDVICPCELTDAPKPLVSRVVDDLPLPVVVWNESMNRAADLILAMRVSHERNAPFENLDSGKRT